MAHAETRSVNRCVYTPVVNSAEVGDDRPGFRARQPFAMLALTRTVLDDSRLGAVVLDHLADHDGGSPSEYAGVVRRAWAGDTAGAVAELSTVDPGDTVRFLHRVLDTQERLFQQADRDVAEVVGRLATDQPDRDVDALPAEEIYARLADTSPLSGRVLQAVRTTPAGLATRLGAVVERLGEQLGERLGERLGRPRISLTRRGAADAGSDAGAGAGADDRADAAAPPVRPLPARELVALPVVQRLQLYTAAQLALVTRKRDILRSIDFLGTAEPLGFLHLERMQFTPVGYVRGELVYSLPLVPGETVRVSHREWSRTETEYITLVATSMETARDDALSEKSELTESVTSQQQHNQALTTSVTASGGFGPLQVSSSVGYNVANSDSNSRTASSKHAQEITRSASTRSKEEHKISFRVTTTREVEDVSFRQLSNITDEAVRWDYHRLMKRWRIDLYRYDIRLTYDLILPEPGSYLLRRYLQIADLDRRLRTPFALRGRRRLRFHGSPAEIGYHNWQALATAYDVALDPPPEREVRVQAHDEQTYSREVVGETYLTIALPEGYRFIHIRPDVPHPIVRDTNDNVLGRLNPLTSLNQQLLRGGARLSNTFDWRYTYDWSEGNQPPEGTVLAIGLLGVGTPTDATYQAWQQAQYAKILDAAKATYETNRQRLADRRAELVAQLDRDDALTLRKMEREEIMKGVLRWVLGHHFEFYPAGLPDLDTDPDDDLAYYSSQTGRVRGGYLDDGRYSDLMARYSQQIRFLQTAIEWENVNYVLYPYFWTDPDRWDLKQSVYHPDFEHRNFLRAGAARVVLTLRPSFEKAFLSFMETGRLDRLLDADHPYVTVAEQLKDYATTNDRYTTPANEEKPENRVDTWYEFTPTGALDVVAGQTLDGPDPGGGPG